MPRRNPLPHVAAARSARRYANSFRYGPRTVTWVDLYMQRYRWLTGRGPTAGPAS